MEITGLKQKNKPSKKKIKRVSFEIGRDNRTLWYKKRQIGYLYLPICIGLNFKRITVETYKFIKYIFLSCTRLCVFKKWFFFLHTKKNWELRLLLLPFKIFFVVYAVGFCKILCDLQPLPCSLKYFYFWHCFWPCVQPITHSPLIMYCLFLFKKLFCSKIYFFLCVSYRCGHITAQ